MKITPITKTTKMSQANVEVFKFTDGLSKVDLAIKIAQNFEKFLPGSRVIYISETGSQVQGTSKKDYLANGNETSASSDFDAKAIYIPSIESLISGDTWAMKTFEFNSNVESKNTESDIDIAFIPIGEFLKKLSGGMETNSIELLFSMFRNDTVILGSEISDLIKDNYKSLLFNETRPLTGFAIGQANKYSVKGDRLRELETFIDWFSTELSSLELSKNDKKIRPINELKISDFINKKNFSFIKIVQIQHSDKTNPYVQVLGKEYVMSMKIDRFENSLKSMRSKFGDRAKKAADLDAIQSVDLKAFSHALRAIYQAKELIETGFLKFPTPHANDIMKVKFGEIKDRKVLSNLIDNLEEELMVLIASGKSELPENSDEEVVKMIKLACYSNVLNI